MSSTQIKVNSLVLYKEKPAVITQIDPKKIEITLAGNKRLRVRPKDVTSLHPGPIQNVNALQTPVGDVQTAWELLAGSETNLQEVAELAFDAYTPDSAWAVWQLAADGLYFSGTPEALQVHSAESVAAIQLARAEKAAEQAAWETFLTRAETGSIAADDGRFLQDVVALALGQKEKSQVLRALGVQETPEKAHAFLLRIGYWDGRNNPYPARAKLPNSSPEILVPALPDEARRDLTHLVALAIDDEGNQDPDDALSWENGRFWVHIADVAALIPPDSPIDLEARARGANLYLPEGTVHMLPEAATRVLGLGLADISPALSFGLTVSATGEIEDVEMTPSWVRVTRMSYAEAEAQLDSSPLREMLTLSQTYAERRRRNGAIEINMPEVRIRVDEDGQVRIRPLPRLRSRDLVRDAMLMTGEAVGRFALQNMLPIPYTIQDPPDELPPPAASPSEMFALRRLLQPSQQSSMPGAHAGLGMEVYVQATSPLRRYLDLVTHQQLRAHLRGETPLDAQELMARVGAAYAVSGEVRWAERQSNRHWTLVYLQQNPEWQGVGIVMDKRGRHDLVLLPDLALDTRLYQKRERPLDSEVMLQFNKANLAQLESNFREIN